MSAHEIEAAIEASVRVIDGAGLTPRRTRDVIWNLFEYQSHFDTGGTFGRVREILRRARYLVPPHDVRLGTDAWQALEGKIGLDAEEPERLAPQVVGLDVMTAAEAASDQRLISYWYALLPWFAEAMGVDLSALASDPHVLAMLAIVERTRSHQVRSDWGLLKPPRPADIPALGQGMRVFAPTWFALEWMLPPQRDRAAVVGAAAEALRRSLEQRSSPADALARALEALGEFNEWSSHIHLFWRGFGYPLDKGPFADRIKRVIDFSGSTPRIHEAAANAELSLQSSPE